MEGTWAKLTRVLLLIGILAYIGMASRFALLARSDRSEFTKASIVTTEGDRLRSYTVADRYHVRMKPGNVTTFSWNDEGPRLSLDEGVEQLSEKGSRMAAWGNGRDASALFAAFCVLGLLLLNSKASAWWIATGLAFLNANSLVFDCVSCASSAGALSLVPYVAITLLIAMAVGIFLAPRNTCIAIGLWMTLAGAFLVQIGLQILQPKFCSACLTIGCAVIFGLAEIARGLSHRGWIGISPPKSILVAVGAIGMALVARNIGYGIGIIPASGRIEQIYISPESVLGALRNVSTRPKDGLVVLASPTCEACIAMRDDLRSSSLPTLIVEPCVRGSLKPCWDPTSLNGRTPTFLLLRNYRPLFVRSGWPMDSNRARIAIGEFERATKTDSKSESRR